MRNKSWLKKGLVCGIIVLFVGTAAIPVIGFQSALNKKIVNGLKNVVIEDVHPDYYNITIWRVHGNSYEKEIKQVSYNIAMQIKDKYEQIEKNADTILKKIEQKNAVLREYEILKENETLEKITNSKNLFVKNYSNSNNRLLQEHYFTNNLHLLDWLMAFTGGILATVHGPVSGINLGIPFPFTIIWEHWANVSGPAEGIGCFFMLPISYMYIPDAVSVRVLLYFAFGIITYLPFILNQHNMGEFVIFVVTFYGAVFKDSLIPRF